ncbi:N-acetylglucosamine kinase [Proteiniphilum sp.]|nr:BadF/BadG/BcrA/BcrD ATPase family protein [Proteiniphilum sp.]MEA4917171.1 BadF/BadG/BcrA/BcrD ATPase family protein [Proteiniphilum sp.]
MLFCGIDGGGTTTTAVVCDERGNILGSFQAGSINHYGVGLEKARENYAFIKEQLIALLGCEPDITYIGNSALDSEATDELVQQLVGGIFHKKTLMHSDVYVALLGFTQGSPGALLISGTGSMACAIDREGNYHTSGGWGQILGDEGSGYHLGLKGVQAALQFHDQMAPPTLLLERLIGFYHLSRVADLIEIVYSPSLEKGTIAAFAIEVEKAALQGDEVSIRLINDEVEWLFRLSESILKKSGVKRLGLYGSMLVKSHIIGPQLISRYSGHDVELLYPRFKPEIGALFGAFTNENISLDEKIIANLSLY